jgi:hypothetical protein
MERVDAGTRLAAHLLIHSVTHGTESHSGDLPATSASCFSAAENEIKLRRNGKEVSVYNKRKRIQS